MEQIVSLKYKNSNGDVIERKFIKSFKKYYGILMDEGCLSDDTEILEEKEISMNLFGEFT